MTSRLITVNDVYSFDPHAQVDFEEFEDVAGRNFRQPPVRSGKPSTAAASWRW
jgi:hypothetical protein